MAIIKGVLIKPHVEPTKPTVRITRVRTVITEEDLSGTQLPPIIDIIPEELIDVYKRVDGKGYVRHPLPEGVAKIKVCPVCGFTFPMLGNACKCYSCGTNWHEGICRLCGKYSDNLGRSLMCREHANSNEKKHKQRSYERIRTDYQQWREDIKTIPQPYSPMSEEDWLRTCRFFDGCAICSSKHIDARYLFVPTKDGGRYCAWNTIPVCNVCLKLLRNTTLDPFKSIMDMHKNYNGLVRFSDKRDVVNKIKGYLYKELEKTKKGGSDAEGKD